MPELDPQAALKTAVLIEALDLTEATFEDNVLRNVVLIREGKSLNSRGYIYPAEVLARDGKVFEGAKAYNDHAATHKTTDITGWYANVRYSEGKLLADRHFTRNQAGQDVKAIAEDIVAGRAPATLAGLSINANGKVRKDNQVESITYAESVDDVANPARGGTYLAAGGDSPLMTALFNSLSYEEFLEARADYVERLRKDFKRVRQDDALKSAEAEAQRIQGELQEAQATIDNLDTAREKALSQLEEAQRALAIEKVLNDPKVKIPASWRESLREQLEAADPDTWGAVIEAEIRKAGSVERKRVPVTGADQQIETPMTERSEPRAHSRAPDWGSILSSPAAFEAWKNTQLRR